jgi:hypothetical protein
MTPIGRRPANDRIASIDQAGPVSTESMSVTVRFVGFVCGWVAGEVRDRSLVARGSISHNETSKLPRGTDALV